MAATKTLVLSDGTTVPGVPDNLALDDIVRKMAASGKVDDAKRVWQEGNSGNLKFNLEVPGQQPINALPWGTSQREIINRAYDHGRTNFLKAYVPDVYGAKGASAFWNSLRARAAGQNVSQYVFPGSPVNHNDSYAAQVGQRALADLGAAVHGAAQLPLGIGQAVLHAVLPGQASNEVDQFINGLNQRYENVHPQNVDTRIAEVAGNLGAGFPEVKATRAVGSALGSIKALQRLGAASKSAPVLGNVLKALDGSPAFRSAAAAVGSGAAWAGATPETNQNNRFWRNKLGQLLAGAATGGVLHGTSALVKPVANTIERFMRPDTFANEGFAKLLAGDQPANAATLAPLLNKLKQAKEVVPGVMPYTHDVLRLPQTAQMQRTMQMTPSLSPEFMRRNVQNASAMENFARNAAFGDAQSRDEMVAQRSQATRDAFEKTLGSATAVERAKRAIFALQDFTQKNKLPESDVVFARKLRRALNKVKPNGMSVAQAQDSLEGLKPETKTGKRMLRNVEAALNENTVDARKVDRFLQDMRAKAQGNPKLSEKLDVLDGMLHGPEGMDRTGHVATSTLDNIRNQLAKDRPDAARLGGDEKAYRAAEKKVRDTIASAYPAYRSVLATYRKRSVPINQLDAMQPVLNAMERSKSIGVDNLAAHRVSKSTVETALERAQKQPKRTRSQGGIASLNAMKQELDRLNSAEADSRLTSNSTTAENRMLLGDTGPSSLVANNRLIQMITRKNPMALAGAGIGEMAANATGAGPVGRTAHVVVGALIGHALGKQLEKVNDRIRNGLAQGILSPSQAARMIQEHIGRDRSLRNSIFRRYPGWKWLLEQQVGQKAGQ